MKETSHASPIVDIAIPCYDANGRGAGALDYALKSIKSQTYKNYNVVISDHSLEGEDNIWKTCNDTRNILPITYIRNSKNYGNASANFNNVLKYCKGDYIKLLCQDDFFFFEDSLKMMVEKFSKIQETTEAKWMSVAYYHAQNDREHLVSVHVPFLNDLMCIHNTIGTPSGIMLDGRNGVILPEFDLNLSYCYDCDFYFRMIEAHGNPHIIKTPLMVNYLWDGSTTSKITPSLIVKEENYIREKYGIQ